MVNIRYMPRSFGLFSIDKNDDVVRWFFWKRAIDSLKDNNLNPFGFGVAIFATILHRQWATRHRAHRPT